MILKEITRAFFFAHRINLASFHSVHSDMQISMSFCFLKIGGFLRSAIALTAFLEHGRVGHPLDTTTVCRTGRRYSNSKDTNARSFASTIPVNLSLVDICWLLDQVGSLHGHSKQVYGMEL